MADGTPRDGDAERLNRLCNRVSVRITGGQTWVMTDTDVGFLVGQIYDRDAALRERDAEIAALKQVWRNADAALRETERRDLFVHGEFTAHSGETLPFKIEADALTDADITALAAEINRRFVRFRDVYGVPRGGQRIAEALRQYCTGSQLDPLLIVDDVLTTGASMIEARDRFGTNTFGVVIFARGVCPDWVTALFTLNYDAAPREAREDGG